MSAPRPERSRIARLRKILEQRRIGALLVMQRENVRYLTGFTGSSACLILADGRPALITDFRYQLQAAREVSGAAVVIQQRDLFSAVGAAAGSLGVRTLWFDEASFTLDRIRALRKQGLRLRGAKDPVAELRQRKDAREMAAIGKAIHRAEKSFRALGRWIRPGVSERELGLRLEWLMREAGSRKAAFDTIVASGPNGAMPHASQTNRRLRRGDLVTIDFGAEADGYFCDITRTVCVGRPTPRQQEVHALVRRAQQAAIAKILPGVPCREVDAAARGIIAAAGYGKEFGHAAGHGIGLMVHEAPSLSRLSTARLEHGMVLTVEPGVYLPGWGGVRTEDMVAVTRHGAKLLTGLSRDL